MRGLVLREGRDGGKGSMYLEQIRLQNFRSFDVLNQAATTVLAVEPRSSHASLD
jgi:hypothetical protein